MFRRVKQTASPRRGTLVSDGINQLPVPSTEPRAITRSKEKMPVANLCPSTELRAIMRSKEKMPRLQGIWFSLYDILNDEILRLEDRLVFASRWGVGR